MTDGRNLSGRCEVLYAQDEDGFIVTKLNEKFAVDHHFVIFELKGASTVTTSRFYNVLQQSTESSNLGKFELPDYATLPQWKAYAQFDSPYYLFSGGMFYPGTSNPVPQTHAHTEQHLVACLLEVLPEKPQPEYGDITLQIFGEWPPCWYCHWGAEARNMMFLATEKSNGDRKVKVIYEWPNPEKTTELLSITYKGDVSGDFGPFQPCGDMAKRLVESSSKEMYDQQYKAFKKLVGAAKDT